MISIIVNNYSYSYLIPLVMQTYNRMDNPPCEVEMIIVDDASDSDDHFEEFVRLGLDRIKPWYKVRAFKMPLKCSSMSIAKSVNIGVKQSKGSILILNPADFVPFQPKTLCIVFQSHQEQPLLYLTTIFKSGVPENWKEWGDKMYPHGCGGASISRKLYYEMGGFDEEMYGYGHNDTDFIWRICHAIRDAEKPWVWKQNKELISMHLSFCKIGVKRSVYPNKHNEEIVARNEREHRRCVNPDGWGKCKDLVELKL